MSRMSRVGAVAEPWFMDMELMEADRARQVNGYLRRSERMLAVEKAGFDSELRKKLNRLDGDMLKVRARAAELKMEKANRVRHLYIAQRTRISSGIGSDCVDCERLPMVTPNYGDLACLPRVMAGSAPDMCSRSHDSSPSRSGEVSARNNNAIGLLRETLLKSSIGFIITGSAIDESTQSTNLNRRPLHSRRSSLPNLHRMATSAPGSPADSPVLPRRSRKQAFQAKTSSRDSSCDCCPLPASPRSRETRHHWAPQTSRRSRKQAFESGESSATTSCANSRDHSPFPVSPSLDPFQSPSCFVSLAFQSLTPPSDASSKNRDGHDIHLTGLLPNYPEPKAEDGSEDQVDEAIVNEEDEEEAEESVQTWTKDEPHIDTLVKCDDQEVLKKSKRKSNDDSDDEEISDEDILFSDTASSDDLEVERYLAAAAIDSECTTDELDQGGCKDDGMTNSANSHLEFHQQRKITEGTSGSKCVQTTASPRSFWQLKELARTGDVIPPHGGAAVDQQAFMEETQGPETLATMFELLEGCRYLRKPGESIDPMVDADLDLDLDIDLEIDPDPHMPAPVEI